MRTAQLALIYQPPTALVPSTLLLATVNHQSPLKPVGLPFVQTSPPSVVQRSGVRTDSVSCWITLTEE